VHLSLMLVVVGKVDKLEFKLYKSKDQGPTDTPSLLESFVY
jgi:hypothetical protein